MDFSFERMDFNDIGSIANYGKELLQSDAFMNETEITVMDVNVRDSEMKTLIKQIPQSIDVQIDEIDKETDLPALLALSEKLINFKVFGSQLKLPKSFRKSVEEKLQALEEENDNNYNSITIYKNATEKIDRVREKFNEEYQEILGAKEALVISEAELQELTDKFGVMITAGEEDLEKYKNDINNQDNQELRESKILLATDALNDLKESQIVIDGFIQKKEIAIINLEIYLRNIRKWIRNNYSLLGHAINSSINSTYLKNKIEQLSELVNVSNEIIVNSSAKLKEVSSMNVKMLQEGTLKKETINKYLSNVTSALDQVLPLIEGANQTTLKLSSDIDKMRKQLNDNKSKIERFKEKNYIPQLSDEKPIIKKLVPNTNNND